MIPQLAAVSFLNAIPLVEWFSQPNAPEVELRLALPSKLAGYLASGKADVGLLPVADVLAGKSAGILSNACIASIGAVDSVKMFVSGDLGSVTRILADRGSRSSVALLKIFFAERFGRIPPVTESKPLPGTSPEPSEAVLVIGDMCFAYEKHLPNPELVQAYDLGSLWYELTGLPIVFAVWAAGPEYVANVGRHELDRMSDLLNQARDFGLSALPDLAVREAQAGRMGVNGEVTAEAIEYYFSQSLHYQLGNSELEGIRLFGELLVKHGLITGGIGLKVL